MRLLITAKKNGKLVEFLSEDIDADTLNKMPEWFKRLREAYFKRLTFKKRE